MIPHRPITGRVRHIGDFVPVGRIGDAERRRLVNEREMNRRIKAIGQREREKREAGR